MGSVAQVALITGGASGMGLVVVEKLVSAGWNICIVDYNEKNGKEVAERLGSAVIFVKCDVTNYDQQVAAFVQTWKKWGRIDFVWANAGIGDRINFYKPETELENGGPPRPDTMVVEVCLTGVIYTSYLALHYFRKNSSKAGKLICTSSEAGIYPANDIPLYGAAKTGVVGLIRAMGLKLKADKEPITVNCLNPGLVPTPLVPPEWLQVTPKEHHTPTSTIVTAIETILADSSITGQAAECSGLEVHYRPVLPYCNAAAEFLNSGALSLKAEDFAAEAK